MFAQKTWARKIWSFLLSVSILIVSCLCAKMVDNEISISGFNDPINESKMNQIGTSLILTNMCFPTQLTFAKFRRVPTGWALPYLHFELWPFLFLTPSPHIGLFSVFGRLFFPKIFLEQSRSLDTYNCLFTTFNGFWHERSAFQSVGVQAVDWHDDSGPLYSLFFSYSFLIIFSPSQPFLKLI